MIAKQFGDETKRTTTQYTGDTTTVTPPNGGTTTTTIVDALGRTTALKEHTGTDTTQSTKYAYDKRGLLDTVTDPSSAKWTYTYDVRGRQIQADDPDKGSTKTQYDQGDRATETIDVGRNITLHTDYDTLGRKTALKKGTTTLADWSYDQATNGKGQLYKATRYVGGKAYESAVTSYNAYYQPILTQVTIPDVTGETALAGTYKWRNIYDANTGLLKSTDQPSMGDLPDEAVVMGYTPITGLLDSVTAESDPLLDKVTYDHYGQTTRQEFGAFAQHMWVSNTYDDHTGNLTHTYTDREVAPARIDDTGYTYDPANNVTSINAAYGQDAARTTDTQCFTYDALRRMAEAWTNTSTTCASGPSTKTVGGQDAYWTSYSYDAVGNRKTETQHATQSGPAADTTRTYTAPATGTHKLPKVTQTGTNPHEESYSYDEAGNTHTRKIGANAQQALSWDDEGHLKTVAQGANTSNYVYDEDGQRLIRRDSTGTTLYLPGGNELHLAKNGTLSATRYYQAGGATVAIRQGGKLSFLISDPHGTGTTQVSADAQQTVTRRKTTPFGATRGTQSVPWVGDKGFVGGTKDTDTGLTHLGAREYDPTLGRFLSVDPVLDLNDPQQINGYTYSNNNPTTFSDPSGLYLDDGTGHSLQREGKQRKDVGKVTGGTGANGCYYTCGAGSTDPVEVGYIPATQNEDRATRELIYAAVAQRAASWQQYQNWLDAYRGLMQDPRHEHGVDVNETIAYAVNVCFGPHSTECSKDLKNFFQDVDLTFMVRAGAYENGGPRVGPLKGTQLNRTLAGCNCFLAGTDVLMSDGKTKDIEDVKVGDKIRATNPETGETRTRKVTHLIHVDSDKHFNKLSIATPDGIEQLTATEEHPFWSPSQNTWVPTRDLKSGMSLLTAEGATVVVTDNHAYTKQHVRTYNLTIDDLHTYYVLAGRTPVLVHNSRAGNLCAHPDAEGPHTTFRRDGTTGEIDHYESYDRPSDPRDPRPWLPTKRVDVKGKPHYDKKTKTRVPTPHVNLPDGSAVPAEPWELPRRNP
ncbi:polymorphic toxin-type HINT domain-containing protein [Streptomyces sp. NBC_01383]|uniref:polymorphic toxin-type HINT domain-containing protein n=1 Tax=Streptomyces sp. NBC_01383 TaxID=2903846 RepID=UPI00324F8ABC